jgi:hypothetical protein
VREESEEGQIAPRRHSTRHNRQRHQKAGSVPDLGVMKKIFHMKDMVCCGDADGAEPSDKEDILPLEAGTEKRSGEDQRKRTAQQDDAKRGQKHQQPRT